MSFKVVFIPDSARSEQYRYFEELNDLLAPLGLELEVIIFRDHPYTLSHNPLSRFWRKSTSFTKSIRLYKRFGDWDLFFTKSLLEKRIAILITEELHSFQTFLSLLLNKGKYRSVVLQQGHLPPSTLKGRGYVASVQKILQNKISYVGTETQLAKKYVLSIGIKEEIIRDHETICVDPHLFDPEKYRKPELRRLYGFTLEDKIILHVGRLIPSKGTHALIQVLPTILEDIPETKLLIVGEGPLKLRLENVASKLGVLRRTRFLGKIPISKMPEIYSLADLVVMPFMKMNEMKTCSFFSPRDQKLFWEDQCPRVILEACLMDLPVITRRNVGNNAWIRDGETGVLLSSLEPEEIATTTLSLLCDEKKAKKMGNKASEFIRAEFNPDICAKRTFELALEAIGEIC